MTVAELETRMDSGEVTEWTAFYRLQGEAERLNMPLPEYLERFRFVAEEGD